MSSKKAFVDKVSELLGIPSSTVAGCFDEVKKEFGTDTQLLVQVLEEHYENLLKNYDHYLVSFPPELKELIVKDFPVKDIVSFCSSSRYLQEICQDEHLWRALFLRDFHSDYFSDNPREDYKKAFAAMRFLKKLDEMMKTKYGLSIKEAPKLVDTIARSIFELVKRGIYDTPTHSRGYRVKRKIWSKITGSLTEEGMVDYNDSSRFEKSIAERLVKFYLNSDTPYETIAAHFWGSEGFFYHDKPHALSNFIVYFGSVDGVVDMRKLSSDITKFFLFVKWMAEITIRKHKGEYEFIPTKQIVDHIISSFFDEDAKKELEQDQGFKLKHIFRYQFSDIEAILMNLENRICLYLPQFLREECRKLIEETKELKTRLKETVVGLRGYEYYNLP